MYSVLATSITPALVICLLDISRSMNERIDGRRKIDLVEQALQRLVISMVRRSTKGTNITPHYRIAMYGYHKEVVDLLGGIKTIRELARIAIPKLTLDYGTRTARGFMAVEHLLNVELPRLQNDPAPLVWHITDGLSDDADPEPVVARIKEMATRDGPVLVENIFLSKHMMKEPVGDVYRWAGITDIEQLQEGDAQRLFAMSSVIPDSYRNIMGEFGYNIQPGARMLFSSDTLDFLKLCLVESELTRV